VTFSYSGNPASSDLDEVRFYSQDTDSDDQLLTNEEITFLINTWKPLYESNIYVAAIVCETISAKFAREVAYSADGVSVQASELQQKYNLLSESLREIYKTQQINGGPDVGGIMYDPVYDPTLKPLIWGVGMNDNFRAGQQDYVGDLPETRPDIESWR